MGVFEKPQFVGSSDQEQANQNVEIPEGLYTKCPSCSEMIFNKQLEENLEVCPKCNHHFPLGAYKRMKSIFDEGTFKEQDSELKPVDILKFTGAASYTERLKKYQKATGLNDAVVNGTGKIEGIKTSMAVMDFNFIAGSMGSVAGERITRAIECAVEEKIPLVIVSASGGARMYEGMFSLMQMAKTSAALAELSERKLPFISILTNPTMGGVTASFAVLGDIIIAEPKAMIGFAGARVIKDTTQQKLPEGFQTAEFLLEHGLIDIVVHRHEIKKTLAQCLNFLK